MELDELIFFVNGKKVSLTVTLVLLPYLLMINIIYLREDATKNLNFTKTLQQNT